MQARVGVPRPRVNERLSGWSPAGIVRVGRQGSCGRVPPSPVDPRRVGDSDVLRHGDVYSGLFQKTSICKPIEDRADGDKGFQTGVYKHTSRDPSSVCVCRRARRKPFNKSLRNTRTAQGSALYIFIAFTQKIQAQLGEDLCFVFCYILRA